MTPLRASALYTVCFVLPQLKLAFASFGDKQGVVTALTDESAPSRRPLVLQGCGELCDYSITGQPGPFFEALRKRVDCEAL